MVIEVDGEVTTIVPDVLKPFWIYVREWYTETKWVHRIDTDYCRIEVLEQDKHWIVGFEDLDEEYGADRPDYDYDEPKLDVIRMNGSLLVTVQAYGGELEADVYYGDTLLFDKVRGVFPARHIGASKTVEISTLPPVIPPIEPGGILDWFATHKLATGVIIVGGIIGIGLAIKKYWKK